ncbi:MAG: 2-dehydro-3-deoxygalactonokinase [Pseudomonadota bacterium]
MIKPDWIAVDWGTTSLRAWAMGLDGVLDHNASDAGMNAVRPGGFELALKEVIERWLSDAPVDVIACGMVGARQGWREAPYLSAPCKPFAGGLIEAPVEDHRFRVRIIPGVSQQKPLDVMRGEETQIAGLLTGTPSFDGVVCLPGTHTKWAQISAGEICHFRTAMTGELFDLLAHRSVLRHAVDLEWSDAVFAEAVDDALSRPERLSTELFTIRATSLLGAPADGFGAARLSGLLIGAELAAMRPYWLGQEVSVIGAGPLSAHYTAALRQMGLEPMRHDVTDMTLAGLSAARNTVVA